MLEVGRYSLTEKDIQYRQKVALVYYPLEKDPHLGLLQLKKAYSLAEILARHGRPITEQVLNSEEYRIEQNSKDPITLKKIIDLFNGDKESYRRVFVLPTYAERVIYFDFFLNNFKIHEKAHQYAVDFYTKIKSDPKNFFKMAAQLGYKKSLLTISKKYGFQWQAESSIKQNSNLKSSSTSQTVIDLSSEAVAAKTQRHKIEEEAKLIEVNEAAHWITEIASPTKPGEVVEKIIDRSEVYMVVRYLGPKRANGDQYNFEVVLFPKINFANWLNEEMRKVVIKER